LKTAKHVSDILSQKSVEISQKEVEVLAKDRQNLEQVPLLLPSQTED